VTELEITGPQYLDELDILKHKIKYAGNLKTIQLQVLIEYQLKCGEILATRNKQKCL
jgi:hypothetical protein